MQAQPYQIEGAEFLLQALPRSDWRLFKDTAPPSRLVFDEQGTGKTVQGSLALAGCLDRPAVVTCPAGMLRTWERHLETWTPRGVHVAGSERRAREMSTDLILALAEPDGPQPALVLSHDILAAAVQGPRSPLISLLGQRAVLLVDEVHMGKSATSRRGTGIRDAVAAAHAGGGAAMGLTATPMPRDPIDLWVILKWFDLADWCFPGGLYEFAVQHFGGAQVQGRWHFPAEPPGGPLGGRFARVCLRRERRGVLPDLPEKHREVRVVPVDGAAETMLDRAARAAAQAAGVDVADLAREDMPEREAQIALEVGRRLEDLTELRVEMGKAKIPALLQWVDELERVGTPCAVYSDHLAPIEALGAVDESGAWKPREGWVVIRGEDTEKARDRAVQAFERGEHTDGRPVWGVAFTGAGRVGISLNRAETLIVVSRSWAYASEEQAEDRILRFGKTCSPLIGYLLLGHPLELFLHRVLAAKRTRSEVALRGCTVTPAAVALPSLTPSDVAPPVAPAPPADRRPWLSHKRLSTRRDCGFAEYARYHLKVDRAQPPESRRMGILFAAAIAGRLVVWARDAKAAAGSEGDAVASAEVKRECAVNDWPQREGSTEEDGRTAVELSHRAMERFGFFAGRWTPYLVDGRPAVEVELRAPLVPASLPFATPEARAQAEQLLAPWAGFYGRADLIAFDREHRGGTGQPRLTVVDFKCKERMSEGLSDGADDLQLMLYLNAARALGIRAELALRLEVRNKLPEEPPLLESRKGLSKDKTNVTDVVLFEKAIARHGFDRTKYAEHLDWLAREGPKCYSPVQCGRTQSALDQAWREMLWDAADMTSPRPVRHLRNFASSPCHSERYGCEYKELCTATLTGTPSPDVYAADLVRLGRLRKTTWRGPKTDTVAAAPSETQAPQEF